MKKRKTDRFLAVFMVLAMMAGMFAGVHLNTVKAADGEAGETTSSGIELSKTATLEDDGTYTINLEAYATGTTTTTTVERNVPLDIVLVLDQSGSMAYDFSGSSTSTNANRRQYAMKQAVNNFIAQVADKYSEDADHRMAIVTFGSSASTLQDWTTVDASGKTSLQSAVSGLADQPSGATNVAAGMTQAQSLISDDSYTGANTDRQTIVIVFTDGVPTTSSDFSTTVADSAIATAKTMKDDGVTIYTVGIFNGADPEQLYGTTLKTLISTDTCDGSVGSAWGASSLSSLVGGDVNEVDAIAGNRFLNYLSSNFMDATEIGITKGTAGLSGTKYTITKNFNRTSSSYYLTADTADALSNVFTSISQDVSSSSTTVTLNANSVMKDIMGDGFTLADDFNVDTDVIIKTYKGSVNEESGDIDWSNEETTNSASAEISDDKTTVSVTGFNYAEKYISSGHEGEKICVTIKGVLPTTDVTTDKKVFTNSSASGIYADATTETAAACFPVPDTIITKKLYVLDYGKEATLSGLDQSSITGIVGTYKAVDINGANNSLTQSYGKSALSNNTLTYTPTTTNWNGYDSLYVFGQTSNETIKSYSANSNGNLWSKVSVIPASNVYYEDDFVTDTTDGTVGITYSGTWKTVSGDTSSASESQSSENILYGTDAAYADDTTYTDGSAHQLQSGATATFTFTGTGVDIYSSTDNDACIVYVYLYDAEDNLKQYVVVNNYADDGKYYVVPTVTFENLAYGTYKVKLRVVKSSTDSEAVNYYLDGIRVYNPLGTVTNDGSDAGTAYAAADELNAVYTEIRTMLLDEDAAAKIDSTNGDGALFIDEIASDTTGETTNVLATYESVGPEHETYLKVGNGVAFTLSGFDADTDAVYVGIKLTGMSTGTGYNSGTVEVTNGSGKTTLTITSTADQYYKITPDENGNVVIKNTSENGAVISLTKIRTTSAGTSSAISVISDADTAEYALTTFSTLSLTGTSGEILTEDETEDGSDDDAVDTETEDDTTGDVVIETETPEQENSSESSSQDIFSSIFNKIIGWFSGRR